MYALEILTNLSTNNTEPFHYNKLKGTSKTRFETKGNNRD